MREQRWVRKWTRDAATDGFSPFPTTRVVSNEEYLPVPPTPQQAEVAARLGETARSHARRLGMSRRGFLASSSGMAAGFLALNAVFGRFFEVDPVEALEPATADARKPVGQFIFDIQTHHEAFRRFTMPEPLMARLGYRPLTPEVKAQILGLNAARLYRIDPGVHRHPVPPDYIAKIKAAYLDEGARPSLTQYGWVLER